MFDALTIMDGNFFSLYPRFINDDIYTLTDVEYTPLLKSLNYHDVETYEVTKNKLNEIKYKMTQKIKTYYKDFEKYFVYDGYFLSKKTKIISSSDNRNIIIEEIEDNVISVNCGKITGIFEWEDYVLGYLIKA